MNAKIGHAHIKVRDVERATAFVACSDAPTRTEVGSPLFEIVDAVHNSGNEHFFFLPPMVSNPVIPQQIQIWNVDPESMTGLLKQAMADRRPLPAPAGVIRGSSADPSAVELLGATEAEELRRSDMGEKDQPPSLIPGSE